MNRSRLSSSDWTPAAVRRFASRATCAVGHAALFASASATPGFSPRLSVQYVNKTLVRIGARGGREKRFQGLRQQRILGAVGNRGVGVGRQNGEQFHAVLRAEWHAARADGQFLFGARVARADLRAQFSANGILPTAAFRSARVSVTLPGCPGVPIGRHRLAVELQQQRARFARCNFKVIMRVELLHVIRLNCALEDNLAVGDHLHVRGLSGLHLESEASGPDRRGGAAGSHLMAHRRPARAPPVGFARSAAASAHTSRQVSGVNPRGDVGAVAMISSDAARNKHEDERRTRRRPGASFAAFASGALRRRATFAALVVPSAYSATRLSSSRPRKRAIERMNPRLKTPPGS